LVSGTEPLSCTVSPIDSAAAQQPGEEAARFHHTQFLKKFEVTAAEYPIVHMVKGDWTAPFRPFESQHLAFEQAHHPFNGG